MDIWEMLFFGGVIALVAYNLGFASALRRHDQARELRLRAEETQDPEERRRLLLAWNKAEPRGIFRREFRRALDH